MDDRCGHGIRDDVTGGSVETPVRRLVPQCLTRVISFLLTQTFSDIISRYSPPR